MAKIEPIRPMHPSMKGSQFWSRAPVRMTAITLPTELHHDITNIALSIFTDCVNGGKTFQDAILAVYLSGIDHGKHGGDDERNEPMPARVGADERMEYTQRD